MSERRAIGVGVVGLGYMGRAHIEAYRLAHEAGYANRLVHVCDRHEARRRGEPDRAGNLDTGASAEPLFDPALVRTTSDVDALLADEEVELVSICTPTDMHVDVAIRAMQAGKHVLVEKPVALCARDVRRAAEVAEQTGRVCMPAMCMRFWPAWQWLKKRVDDGSLGDVRSATFHRLGSRPMWGEGFYQDDARSGGALFDVHVHDADFVRWCFGEVRAVMCAGSLDHVTAIYRMQEGPVHIAAEGGWDHHEGFGFIMRYTVVFERATATWQLGMGLTLVQNGEAAPIPLDTIHGWDGEVRHVLNVIAAGARPEATLADAIETTRLLEAERLSLAEGREAALVEVPCA